MAHALALIRTWPVASVAAAVRDPTGAVHVEGDGDQLFALAAVTKLLTALAVHVACEEGSTALDHPVPFPPGATVRDLLCHASGLAPDRDAVVAPPRHRRIYANRGYELLAALVADCTGISFPMYLREAVLDPLGMRASALTGSAGSGAVSTVHDLLRLASALTEPGVVSAATLTALRTPQYPDLAGVLPGFGSQHPNPWGLGPEVRGAKAPHWTGAANSPHTFGHFGQTGTALWVDPDAQCTLVVLTNEPFGDWARTAWPVLADAVLAQYAAVRSPR